MTIRAIILAEPVDRDGWPAGTIHACRSVPTTDHWLPADMTVWLADPDNARPTGFDQEPMQVQNGMRRAVKKVAWITDPARTTQQIIDKFSLAGEAEAASLLALSTVDRTAWEADGVVPGFGYQELKIWAPITFMFADLHELASVEAEKDADTNDGMERVRVAKRRLKMDMADPRFSASTRADWANKSKTVIPNGNIGAPIQFNNMTEV